MSERVLVFPAGKAIYFTQGEYSDYGVCGAIVTLKEMDLPKLVAGFKDKHQGDDDFRWHAQSSFIAYLIAEGYAFPAEIEEVYLGSYGEINVS